MNCQLIYVVKLAGLAFGLASPKKKFTLKIVKFYENLQVQAIG